MKRLFYILLLFFTVPLNSQELSGGVSVATLFPSVGEWRNINDFVPFSADKYMVGCVVNYAPAGRQFFYNTGLSLMTQNAEQFLQVPMTVNVFFGDVFKAYLTLGFYNTFRISPNTGYYNGYDLGLIYGIGTEYKTTNHIRIFIEYNLHQGILPFERDALESDLFYTSDYAFLHFGFKYIFQTEME